MVLCSDSGTDQAWRRFSRFVNSFLTLNLPFFSTKLSFNGDVESILSIDAFYECGNLGTNSLLGSRTAQKRLRVNIC